MKWSFKQLFVTCTNRACNTKFKTSLGNWRQKKKAKCKKCGHLVSADEQPIVEEVIPTQRN